MNDTTGFIKSFRTPLMGVAIIAVMTVHLLQFCHPLKGFLSFLYEIPNMIFTDGFLFLSGFGLYFSYVNSKSLKEFYLKRVKRLLVPYMLIAAPLLLFPTYTQYGMNMWAYLGRLTTLGYWVEGNFCSMWYIAVSIVLYICYPWLHSLLKDSGVKTLFIVLIIYIIFALCRHYLPDLYWKLFLVLQVPCFFFGIYCASLSNVKKVSYGEMFSVLFLLYMVAVFMDERGCHFEESLILSLHRLSYLVVFAYVFKGVSSSRYKIILCPFQWLGKYTLELYILHVLLFSNLSLLFGEIDPLILMCLSIFFALIMCRPIHLVVERIISNKVI